MVKFDYTKDDIRRIAKEENVRFLRLMFTDLYGTIKNVEVPISQLDKVLDNKMTVLSGLKKVICGYIQIYQHG